MKKIRRTTKRKLSAANLESVRGGAERVITQNDAIGTRDYSIDCITGASTRRCND